MGLKSEGMVFLPAVVKLLLALVFGLFDIGSERNFSNCFHSGNAQFARQSARARFHHLLVLEVPHQ
jgi:hypothetical protein